MRRKDQLKLFRFLNYSWFCVVLLFSLFLTSIGFSASPQETTSKMLSKEKKIRKLETRKRLKSILAKKLSSKFATAQQDTFNEDMKEVVNRVSYRIADAGRVGLVVKNRQQVGLSLKF